MVLVCTRCWEEYDISLYEEKNIYCPKKSCQASVKEIDDIILETIKVLNRKGLETQFCCAGHSSRPTNSMYILFVFGCKEAAELMKDQINKTLPYMFCTDEIEDDYKNSGFKRFSIRLKEIGNTKAHFILNSNLILLEWAEEFKIETE